jgi:hypothetical protein
MILAGLSGSLLGINLYIWLFNFSNQKYKQLSLIYNLIKIAEYLKMSDLELPMSVVIKLVKDGQS